MDIQKEFSLTLNTDKDTARVSIEGVLPVEKIKEKKEVYLSSLGKDKKIDGFRAGKAPGELVEKQAGDSFSIWKTSAQHLLIDTFPEMLGALSAGVPLGQPELAFTNIADAGPAAFKVSFFILPEISIDNYKGLAESVGSANEPAPVEDKEVEDTITEIQKSVYMQNNKEAESPPEKESDLPELTDEFVQQLSSEYKTVDDFRKSVRMSISQEKALRERSNHREKILEALLKEVTITIPEVLIEAEARKAKEEIEENAKRFGTTLENYLKEKKISQETFEKDIKEDSKKRAEVQVLLNTIAQKEHIHPSDEMIEKEVTRLKPRAGHMSIDDLRVYITSLLTNEQTLSRLESFASGK